MNIEKLADHIVTTVPNAQRPPVSNNGYWVNDGHIQKVIRETDDRYLIDIVMLKPKIEMNDRDFADFEKMYLPLLTSNPQYKDAPNMELHARIAKDDIDQLAIALSLYRPVTDDSHS